MLASGTGCIALANKSISPSNGLDKLESIGRSNGAKERETSCEAEQEILSKHLPILVKVGEEA